jgi:protein-S-isoprenylcysteine O-methyltransferase Ste14
MSQNKYFTPNKKLAFAGIKKYVTGIFILGALLFFCAGDLCYWNAWLYLGVLSVAIFAFGIYLYRNDQALLEKRLNSKEKQEEQKAYNTITSLSFLVTFAVCSLDYRFRWSYVSPTVVIIALVVMLIGFGLFVLTLLQNRFASRIIEIQEKQQVIDTGIYSLVRHPLYSAAIIMCFASPVVLGSMYAVIPMLFYLAGIILRIRNEEKFLRNGLEGYASYIEKVKYRLIPYVW